MTYINAQIVPSADSVGLLLKNQVCNLNVYVGALVYISASQVAENGDASDISTSRIVGVVDSKPSDTICNTRIDGVFTSNTVITNKDYFLSSTSPGEYTTVVPSNTGNVVVLVGTPLTSNKIKLNIDIKAIRA